MQHAAACVVSHDQDDTSQEPGMSLTPVSCLPTFASMIPRFDHLPFLSLLAQFADASTDPLLAPALEQLIEDAAQATDYAQQVATFPFCQVRHAREGGGEPCGACQ